MTTAAVIPGAVTVDCGWRRKSATMLSRTSCRAARRAGGSNISGESTNGSADVGTAMPVAGAGASGATAVGAPPEQLTIKPSTATTSTNYGLTRSRPYYPSTRDAPAALADRRRSLKFLVRHRHSLIRRQPELSCPALSVLLSVATDTSAERSTRLIVQRLLHASACVVARAHTDAPSIEVVMSAATAGPENNSALVRERHIAPRTIRSPIPGYSSSTGAIALSIQP